MVLSGVFHSGDQVRIGHVGIEGPGVHQLEVLAASRRYAFPPPFTDGRRLDLAERGDRGRSAQPVDDLRGGQLLIDGLVHNRIVGVPIALSIGAPTRRPDSLAYMGTWAQRIEQRLADLAHLGKDRPGLARACGIKPASVSGWFGRGTKPTLMIRGDNLIAAAKYLNTSPEWIMTGFGSADASQSARPDPRILTLAVKALKNLALLQAGEATFLYDAPSLLALYDALSREPPSVDVDREAVLRRMAAAVREVANGRGMGRGDAVGAGGGTVGKD